MPNKSSKKAAKKKPATKKAAVRKKKPAKINPVADLMEGISPGSRK